MRERWRQWRAARRRAARVERITQGLITASGYDVKFPGHEAWFREHAEQIVATEERAERDKKGGSS